MIELSQNQNKFKNRFYFAVKIGLSQHVAAISSTYLAFDDIVNMKRRSKLRHVYHGFFHK